MNEELQQAKNDAIQAQGELYNLKGELRVKFTALKREVGRFSVALGPSHPLSRILKEIELLIK